MPSDEQLAAINTIASSSISCATDRLLGNLLEGHLKVVLVEALLNQGYSVLEGCNVKDMGTLIWLKDGKLGSRRVPRDSMAAALGSGKLKNSPDIRVYSPCKLVVELQVRSEYGTQAALFSDNVADDLDRIDRAVADLFLLVADRDIYNALRGFKLDARGRKPSHCFDRDLPEPTILSPGETFVGKATTLNNRAATAVAVRSTFGTLRVICGVWRTA